MITRKFGSFLLKTRNVTCISLPIRVGKAPMKKIKAIGFDLFNTLITVEPYVLDEAMDLLIRDLQQSGFTLENEAFKHAHQQAALQFIKQTRLDGRETHNSFWISSALETLGYSVPPDDVRIAKALDEYFSPFYQRCQLIPGTIEMLGTVKGQYPLGLLSNFTHAPAAEKIIDRAGLSPYFDVVVISGEAGYRKPHPLIFRRFIDQLGVEENRILFVGDDSAADIVGAQQAGLQPVWMTYVQDKHVPIASSLLARSIEEPDKKIPRISSWTDLFALLDED
jgi:putative hydrolase of the HAD superfamily